MAADELSPADAASLEALISRSVGQDRGLPPVDQWHPERCGDLDMEIKADGTWFYRGTPISREPMVRLFSTILRKDADGGTYLVTPVEKLRIRVEDAPFIAVEVSVTQRGDEQVLTFRTNVGDIVEAGSDHPLRFDIADDNEQLKPYLRVRGRLEALFSRAVMYEVVDLGRSEMVDGVETFCVGSGEAIFPIMPMSRLEELSQ